MLNNNNSNKNPGLRGIKDSGSEICHQQQERLLFISSAINLELFNDAYTDKVKISCSESTNGSSLSDR